MSQVEPVLTGPNPSAEVSQKSYSVAFPFSLKGQIFGSNPFFESFVSSSVLPDWAFLKAFGQKILKNSPKFALVLGYFERITLFIKPYCDYFVGKFWNILATFIPTSGHAAPSFNMPLKASPSPEGF